MKNISIITVFFVLASFAFSQSALTEKEIKIKDPTSKITPCFYKTHKQKESPYKTILFSKGDKLSLDAGDFEKGDILGFMLECEPTAPSNSKWLVEKKNIKTPAGLKIVRPKGQVLGFTFAESIRFKVVLDKKIQGTITWVLSRKDINFQEQIDIPISITPKPDLKAMEEELKEHKEQLAALKEKVSHYEEKMDEIEQLEEYKKKINELEEQVANLQRERDKAETHTDKAVSDGKTSGNSREEIIKKQPDVIDSQKDNFSLILVVLFISGTFVFYKLWKVLKEKKPWEVVKEMIKKDRLPLGTVKAEEKEDEKKDRSTKESETGKPLPTSGQEEPEFTFEPRQKMKSTFSRDDLFMVKRSGKEYYRTNLHDMWKDTSVSVVYFKRSCAVEMDVCVTRSYAPEMIPETAGFLLGQYVEGTAQKERKMYEVVCEVFIPAQHIQSNQLEVEFTPETFRDLAAKSDKYPNLKILGWFHTHPNWGVFLSDRDENIHENYFRKKWQIAVVVDPLSDKIGIFTWGTKNQLNNAPKGLNKKDFVDWSRLKEWLKVRE